MTPRDVKEKLKDGPLFDCFITDFGFAPHKRDFDVLFDMPSVTPNGKDSYWHSQWRYRFTHCFVVEITITLNEKLLAKSWSDDFVGFESWKRAGEPDGFLWGGVTTAYPGLTYIDESEGAHEWSKRLKRPMHEVTIETNYQKFRLIFHDVIIEKVLDGP